MRKLSIIILLFLVACQKPQQASIQFTTTGDEFTKAALTPAGSDKISTSELSSFGLYASISDHESPLDVHHLFLGNAVEKVSKNGTVWEYTHQKYWEYSKHYHFRAYHPFDGDFIVNYSQSSSESITIEYQVGVNNQSDLLFAYSSCDAYDDVITHPVNMVFKHALAALEFRIKLKDEVEGEEVIDNFYLKGLHPTAIVQYTHSESNMHEPIINWAIPKYFEEDDEFFKWWSSSGKTFSASSLATIFDGDGAVFVIPQKVKPGKTKVYFTVKSTGDSLYEVTLPEDTWEIGKYYIYTISLLGPSADLSITIKDWDKLETSHSIYL